MEEDGDLALEDAARPKKGGPVKNQGTPSTTAKASIEDPLQVSSASSRTPEALGPKEPKVSTGPKKEPKPGEGSSSKPTPASSKQKADGKGGGSGKEKNVEKAEEHSISTPPEVRQPLFNEEQIEDLNEMYQQIPWLYNKFEPQTLCPPCHALPSLLMKKKEEEQRFRSKKRRRGGWRS